MSTTDRLSRLRQLMAVRKTEALLVSQPENRRYLSGFDGTAGLLLITAEAAVLVTDSRYTQQAGQQAPDYRIIQMSGDVGSWFPDLVEELHIKRLGFEADHLSFDMSRRLGSALDDNDLPTRLVPTTGIAMEIRMTKEPEEVELITRAIAISDNAMDKITAAIEPGMTEEQAAWEIEQTMRTNGSQTLPFEVILAAGPNAALPHAKPSDYVIQPGQPVVIDIGARVQGYGSDLSRSICAGEPDETFKKVYKAVKDAQAAAIAGAAAGMTGAHLDQLARDVIDEAGYGDKFGHGLGHGLGLAPHEKPHISPRSEDVLADGMVFTIEPGIYLSGWGGVRIEDTVIMENGRIRVLSQAIKMEV